MSKKTKNIKKDNETSLMHVFMSAPALLCIVRGPNHVFELANALFMQFVGNKEVINKSVREAVPELEGQGFFELLDKVYATGETISVNEMPLKLKVGNGTFKEDYFNVVFQPMYDANERVNGVYVHAIAVTEQVLVRQKIEENEYRFTEMVNSSPSLISILKGENMIIDIANATILESWGKGNVIGQSLFDAMPESVEQGFDKLLLGVYKTGEPVKAHETPVTLTRNGIKELVYYDFIYQAQRNKNGDIEGVAVLANEVTRQVHAKNKIEESEKRFKNVLLESPNIFVIIEGFPEMIITFANEPLYKSWGRTAAIIGKPMLEVLPEIKDQPFPKLMQRVFETGETYYSGEEKAVIIKNSVSVDTYYYYVYQPIFNDIQEVTGVTIMATDITEQVEVRKKIEESEEQQAFLLKFSDKLRVEPTVDAVANCALQMLSEHLKLDRCYIGVYQLAEDRGVFPYQVGNELVPPIPDSVRLSDFPDALRVAFDRTLVIDDVTKAEGLSDTDRQNLSALGLCALVAATLRHGENNPLWSIVSVSASPRRWTLSDVKLIEEVTERTWAAIERAKAEEALRKSEEKYRSLFNSIDSGFCILEVLFNEQEMPYDYRFLEANNSFEKQTGLKDAVGKSMKELATEHEQHWFDIYGQIAKTRESERFENEAKALGIYYDVYAFPVGEPKENRVGVLFNDITERKQTEEKIRESEERYHTMFMNSPFAFSIMEGKDMKVTLANDLIKEFWGKGKDVEGKTLLEILPELSNQPFPAMIDSVYTSGEPVYANEMLAQLNRNGIMEDRYFNIVYEPQLEADGTISGVITIAHEVTQLVLARQKIEESETLFRLALLLTAKTVFKQDTQLRYTWIYNTHPKFVEKELLGKSDSDLFDKDAAEILTTIKQTVLNTGNTFTGEIQIEIDGKLLDFEMSVEATKNSAGKIDGIIAVSNDITERKAAEQTILNSFEEIQKVKQQLELSIAAGKIGLWHWDVKNDILTWSKEQKEIYGVSDSEGISSAEFNALIVPEDLKRIQDDQSANFRLEHEYDFRIIRKDNSQIRWVKSRAKNVLDVNGELEFIIGVNIDITEQVITLNKIEESEQEIRKIKEQLELSLAAGKIGLWHWDVKTDVLQWSNEQKEMYGIEQSEELNGLAQIQSFILPEDWERIVKNIQGPNIVLDQEYEFRIKRKNDGEIRWLKSKSKVSLDEKGNLKIISGINIDISEQRAADEKLKESESRFRSMADASPVLIWTIDAHGLASYYNKTFRDFIGVSKEEDISDWGKIVHPDDVQSILDAINRSIAEHHSYGLECRLLRADGQWRWVLAQGNPRFGANNEFLGFVGSSIDITERKLFENKLIEANELAENAAKSKQQFLSNMSHEIRTPMNAIVGFTHVVLKTTLNEKQKEYINAIKASGESLLVLIDDILDLAKVDAGKMVFQHTPFKLSDCMTTILHLFDIKIKEKNIALVKEYDAAIPEVLLGDPVRLQQIFINLINNAIKFTEKGTITVCARLLNEDNAQATIEFTISDTGIGIPQNKLNDIFGAFEQAHLNSSLSYGGTGLGLPIVKQLVEHQGGSVSVQSKEGEGSVFGFVLGFEKTEAQAVPKAATEETPTLKNVKILVAEDVKLNQLLIRILLEDFGVDVDIADNGKIAIEKLKSTPYDIILMDLQMPEMNGFEATMYIRNQLKSNIPIIALTADVTTVDVEKCKAVGMNDYISKPIDEKLLYEKIIKYLPIKQQGINSLNA